MLASTVATLCTLHGLDSFAQGSQVASRAPEPTVLRFETRNPSTPLGTTERVCVQVIYSNGEIRVACELDWRVTNPDPSHPVAVAEEIGITGLSVGQATIMANYQGLTVSALFTVTEPVLKNFTMGPLYPTIREGSIASLSVMAEFASCCPKPVVRGVRWTVAAVEPATEVAVIDQTGQARGLHPGMAEIRATWMGKTASTMLSVVRPSTDAPEPVRIPGLRLKTWRRLCMARLRSIWLPRLRALPNAKVELKSTGDRTFVAITVAVRQAAVEREINIHWTPDECDAGGPTGGWTPTGFDWHAPSTQLEHVLAAAGYDCSTYLP